MSNSEQTPHLNRVLGLWDLVFYGIVLIQPIAAVGLFGVAQQLSHGQMVTTVLIAMLAMMLTAVSYGRMASVYPSAGSAYTYVSRGLNEHIGFLAGWAMVLDYLVVPIVSTVYAALTLTRMVPQVPYAVWVVLLTALITALNVAGIRSAAKSNILLLGVMCVVIVWFFVMTIRYLALHGGAPALFSLQPIYNPVAFDWRAVFTATSFAALTYIGFDGVTTLAEDVRNPRKNVLIATVLVCLLTGIMSSLQVYLATRVWPTYNDFPNVETAFLDVCGRAGGPSLFQAMAVTLFVACVGSSLTGQLGAARLLYGMGRDGVLPSTAFGRLNGRGTPVINMLLIGAITLAGSLTISYEHAAEVLNFGAFIAFMGVNVAAMRTFYRRGSFASLLRDVAVPLGGFLFCAVIWISLPRLAKEIGATWLFAGLAYLTILTRGFNRAPVQLHFSESNKEGSEMIQGMRKESPVAVIGMGLMGRSIAACLTAAGHHVTGVADKLETSSSVPERIRALLVEMAEEGLLTEPPESVMKRFLLTAELGDIASAQIVVESITEDLNVKRELLQRVEQVVAPGCILATNTSAIPVSLMQEGAKHPERILGLHWDEPAHVTRFMEIIPGKATAPEYLDRVTELARAWGKEPSKLRKEIRGFITNRVSYAMFREACYLVDSGVCTVEDVDRSLRNDVGWWIPFAGPFRYMDLMGVEGYGRVMRDLLPVLSSSPEVPKLMRDVVESGGRGISNGRGFYQYTAEEAKAWEERFIEFNYKIRRLTVEYADLQRGREENQE